MNNVVPYWINTYFKNPSYLKVDNKPVVYVYDPSGLIGQLGGAATTNTALAQMRQACQNAGFAGLDVIAQCRSTNVTDLQNLKDAGFDANWAYENTPQSSQPTATQAINDQVATVNAWKTANVLPFVPTASMGWDMRAWASILSGPYNPLTLDHWKLNPTGNNSYQTLLGRMKSIMDGMPQGSLSSKMLLLDNWNEWGEGHYIAPNQQDGFGYLQAVRNTFTAKDNTPDYLTPQQQGFGPYDSIYRNFFAGDKNGVVYKDTFARTGDLHRSAVGVGIGSTGWGMWAALPSYWTTDGTKLSAGGQGNAFLPFTPADKKIYTFSADIQVTGTDSSKWLAIGFTNNDDLYNGWDTAQNSVAWWREYAVTNQLQTFLGPNGASGLSAPGGSAGFNHFSILLDTTEANWTAQWYFNGQLERTAMFATDPTISFVGLGGLAPGAIENFSLTVVEPGDANMDGRVDVSDLAILAANYRKHVTGGWTQADFNGDGVVDVQDLAVLAANYRHSLASDVVPAYDGLDAAAIELLSLAGVTVVPEPGALVLLVHGADWSACVCRMETEMICVPKQSEI